MADPPTIRRPKLAHVAMAAGVSLGTASDALRGKGRMSDETRHRVISAAESMGYRPNANARVLAMGHSQIVALVAHGPGTRATPRIYWPRLQAAFTEHLLENSMVACTMTLDDLHKLDGPPFDLIVYADLDGSHPLPDPIRADYRVLDIDIAGDGPLSRSIREQFAGIRRAAFDHLIDSGSQRPGLAHGGGAGELVRAVYESWCAERGLTPTTIQTTSPDRSDMLDEAIHKGLDGLFSVLADHRWLASELVAAAGKDAEALPVIGLGLVAASETGRAHVASLIPDGHSLGTQIADTAIAVLHGTTPRDLTLEFLLDGEPFPTP